MNRNDGAVGDARKARESARLEAGDVKALYETPADAEYPDVLHDDVPARVDWWWTAEGRARVIADAKAEAWDEALGSCNDYSGAWPNPYREATRGERMNETHSVESDALRLAEESFRHSWDMSDERLIDGAWVAGLCCECGDFVPYGGEVAHVAAALAHLIDRAKAEAWDDGHDCCSYPICRANPYRVTSPADGRDPVAEFITAERALHADGCLYPEDDCTCETPGSGRA